MHERRYPKHEQNVRDIAPNDIADSDTGVPGERGMERNEQLRRRSAYGDNGEPNDNRADGRTPRERQRPTAANRRRE